MPVAITTLGLNRVRRTDSSPQATVDGTGFSAANNTVLVSGSAAPIVVQGATQITFDLPAPFSLDVFALRSIHVPVIVVNNDTGESSTDAWLWIKADLDEVADERVQSAIPGPFEITSLPQAPDRFGAVDMQRLATLVDALLVDVQAGNVLAWDGTKVAEPAGLKGGGAGQVLSVDLAEPTDLKWGFKLDALLRFGGFVSLFLTGNLKAGGDQADDTAFGTGSGINWALDDGTLDLITLRNRTSGGATLDRVRVLVNGAPAFDSGAGLGAGDYHVAISVAVLKDDTVELEVTRLGGTGIALVGGIRLVLD